MAAVDYAVPRDVRAEILGEERRLTALFGIFHAASAGPSTVAPAGDGSTLGERGQARRPRAPVVGPAVRRLRRTSFSPNWVLG
ncbi:hypothetical protein [Streptomyces sp. NPDC007172]|uniref:hypothetical protein n=1 Tax=unclassified Streptomyces TaxID=2593676 RepID=UPI00369A40EC